MQVGVLRSSKRALARGAALLILGGLSAGCSSQAMRFSDGLDGVLTGSTPNQRAIISGEAPAQPMPAAIDESPTGALAAPSSGGITKSSLPPVAAASPAAEEQPVREARSEEIRPLAAENPTEEEPAPAKKIAGAADDPAGWSSAGGTQITAREGETVFNLSRRYGVPADVLMKVNGIDKQGGLKAGQKVTIPTYIYSAKAPVSSPDSNPNVAEAKSSRGTKFDVPADKVPVPSRPEKVAVLPQKPKPEEGAQAAAADAAPAARAEGKGRTYEVASGDTLSKIAKKTGVSVAALKKANKLEDGVLRIGQTLAVPAGGEQVAAAQPVDGVTTGSAGPAKKKGEAQAEVVAYTPPQKKLVEELEQDKSDTPDATGIGRMRWPVRGRVISGFGKGAKSNDGIDIQVPEGTPVKAAENGVVIYAGDGLKEFGNTVLVRHENGLVTVYGHASALKVERGQKVKRGQEIALSGMSGSTDAPKLHFEVRKDSAPVDPSGFLE